MLKREAFNINDKNVERGKLIGKENVLIVD
jgi:hypothetical protein